MAEEIQATLNTALKNVVSICSETAEKVENSQNELQNTLFTLEEKVKIIKELSSHLDDTKITSACESIEKYKIRLERIQKRIEAIKSRVTKFENKISA